jgi:hypothetical protein
MGARRLLRTASTRTCRTLCLVRRGGLVWLVRGIWRTGSLTWPGAVMIGRCRERLGFGDWGCGWVHGMDRAFLFYPQAGWHFVCLGSTATFRTIGLLSLGSFLHLRACGMWRVASVRVRRRGFISCDFSCHSSCVLHKLRVAESSGNGSVHCHW